MDAVEEVKSRLAIEDVIGEYVQLKRSGRNLKGLSPFTNEKTPSFMVSPEKQIWHDFSSGKGGNMFSFVMEMEGLEFKGALELLARKAGVDLAQYQGGRSQENAKLKERIYEALELTARFYQAHFKQNQAALDYIFKKRRFTKEAALDFQIGYAPNTGTALADFLRKKGFSEQEMQRAGLVTKRFKTASDMFRGRIMIPLADAQGRVIGFTARLLEDIPDAPKYINTPQTLVYDKSRHVFGLHLAKEAIRRQNYAVAAEGNLDVIASHQAGIKHVVATAGTAMTEHHLKILGRFTQDIRIAFDADAAGQNAVERTIPLASKAGVNLSIISIPEGKDPDELIKKDPKAWEKVIGQNEYALDWLIGRYERTLDLESAEGKRRFSDIVMTIIRQLTDPVEQDHYLRQIAEKLGVSVEALQSKLRTSNSRQPMLKKRRVQSPELAKEQIELTKLQDHLLALTLHQPALRHYLEPIADDMLPAADARQLLVLLKRQPDFDAGVRDPRPLQQIADYVKIVRLQYETLYQDLDELELEYEAARLQARLIGQYVKTKKAVISAELHGADETKTKELLEAARALDLLRKTT